MLRLAITALLCAGTTVLIAGAMAWGYVDAASRSGAVYHWLYSGPLLVSRTLGESGWGPMVAVYFVQYFVVFSVAMSAWRALRRRSNPASKRTPGGAA